MRDGLELTDLEPRFASSPPGPTLQADGLSVRVGGATRLRDATVALRRGAITAVMGPNGAGKSLLLRALHGLIAPSAGRVLQDGRPLDRTARRAQAMLFQSPVLLRRSALGNVRFALKCRRIAARRDRDAEALRMLAHVGLADRADAPASTLSGGQKQRLAFARALALRPRALLLDEPTANLDPSATARIEALTLQARDDGIAVAFVTHDAGQARRIADHVVFLEDGQVVETACATRFFDAPRSPAARAFLDGRLCVDSGGDK